jgi:hypothetical protein
MSDDAIPTEEIPGAEASEAQERGHSHVFAQLKSDVVKSANISSQDRIKEFEHLTGKDGHHVSDRAAKFMSPVKSDAAGPQSAEKRGPSAADKFRAKGAGAGLGDRCKSCDKMVYTAEKIIAQGFSWHKACFTCGHKTGNGCNKVLLAGGYEEHGGVAYCKNCSRKLFQGQVTTLAKKAGWAGSKPISHGALSGVMSPIPGAGQAPPPALLLGAAGDAPPARRPSAGGPPVRRPSAAPPAPVPTPAATEGEGEGEAVSSTSPPAAPAEGEELATPGAATTSESEEASSPLEGGAADAAAAGAETGEEYAEGGGQYYVGEDGHNYYMDENGVHYYQADDGEYYPLEGSYDESAYATEEGGAAAAEEEGAESADAADAAAAAASGAEEEASAPAASAAGGDEAFEHYQDEHHYAEGEEAAVEAAERTVAYYECPYTAPFDKKGAIYWVGTSGHQIEFENPQVTGLVYVEISTLYRGQLTNITSYAEQTTAAERIAFATYTNNQPRSWLLVDFGPDRRLRPSYYCLKHGASGVGNAMRNWVLEGKADENGEWVMLSRHSKDMSLKDEPGSVAGYEVTSEASKSAFFRMFRLTQVGKNSGNNDCMFIGGIEFYGILQIVFG